MACSTTVTRAIGSVCLLNLTGRYRRLVAMTVRINLHAVNRELLWIFLTVEMVK